MPIKKILRGVEILSLLLVGVLEWSRFDGSLSNPHYLKPNLINIGLLIGLTAVIILRIRNLALQLIRDESNIIQDRVLIVLYVLIIGRDLYTFLMWNIFQGLYFDLSVIFTLPFVLGLTNMKWKPNFNSTFIALVLLISTSSCKNESKLEGFWISKNSSGPETVIYEFRNQKVVRTQLGDDSYGNFDTVIINESPFTLTKDSIRWSLSKEETLRYELNDSLTIFFPIGNSQPDHKFVFYRFGAPSSTPTDIPDGAYTVYRSDTALKRHINFIQDGWYITGERTNSATRWKICNVGNTSIFLTSFLGSDVGIVSKDRDTIRIQYKYEGEPITVTLVPQDIYISDTFLLGTWHRNLNNAPPPPPAYAFHEEEEVIDPSYIFTPDSLKILNWYRTETLHWRLTSDGNYIYFPDILGKSGSVWPILNESGREDSLVLQAEFEEKLDLFRRR